MEYFARNPYGFVAFGTCLMLIGVTVCGASARTANVIFPGVAPHSNRGPTSQMFNTKAATGNVTFTIKFTPKKRAGAIRAKYISPATQSIQILTDGANAIVVNLEPTPPECSPDPKVPGAYICRVAFNASVGNHVFTVTTYDQLFGYGNILSTNQTGTVVVKAVGATTIALALEGVVRSIYLSIAVNNPPIGTPAKIPLTVYIGDADGRLIVGAAPFLKPVTLMTTDAVNASLSKTLLKSPADAAGITVAYSGAPAGAALSATVDGLEQGYVGSNQTILSPISTPADRYQTLYSFKGAPTDGANPDLGLTNVGGQLYGGTTSGGKFGYGTLFKISRTGRESVVYNFMSLSSQAYNPSGTLTELNGYLYAMANASVVKFSPSGGAPAVVYRFPPTNSVFPFAPGLLALNGTLYGTTQTGGLYGKGSIFALSASGAERTLHSFRSTVNDGFYPAGPPVEINGELYGATSAGPSPSSTRCYSVLICGTVYKISRSGAENILYGWPNFDLHIEGNLTALDGVLYASAGYIFKLTAAGIESPFFYPLYPPGFSLDAELDHQVCSLTSAADAMYGITCGSNGFSTQIFKLLPSGAAVILHTFKTQPGFVSLSVVGGTMYGLTSTGGTYNNGTIFEIPL